MQVAARSRNGNIRRAWEVAVAARWRKGDVRRTWGRELNVEGNSRKRRGWTPEKAAAF